MYQGGTRSKFGNDTTFGLTITVEGGGSGGHGYTVNENWFWLFLPWIRIYRWWLRGLISGGGGGYSEGNVGEGETGENRRSDRWVRFNKDLMVV